MLFITAALALASSAGSEVAVIVPENGYIGLNIPLTRARSGSASTRTTHPHFLDRLAQAARTVGVTNPLLNPYRFATKGEMLVQSRNSALLADLAPQSVSCSHAEASRMQRRPQGNCGYCYPCMIRRAAMAAPGWDHGSEYAWDVLRDDQLIGRQNRRRGADLRALLNGVFAHRSDLDLIRNAPLPAGSHAAHLDTWRRGTAEIRRWLHTGATGALAQVLETLA